MMACVLKLYIFILYQLAGFPQVTHTLLDSSGQMVGIVLSFENTWATMCVWWHVTLHLTAHGKLPGLPMCKWPSVGLNCEAKIIISLPLLQSSGYLLYLSGWPIGSDCILLVCHSKLGFHCLNLVPQRNLLFILHHLLCPTPPLPLYVHYTFRFRHWLDWHRVFFRKLSLFCYNTLSSEFNDIWLGNKAVSVLVIFQN